MNRSRVIVQKHTGRTLAHLFLLLTSFLMVVPFLWMVSTAFKSGAEIYVYPPTWIPSGLHWENFRHVWRTVPFWRFYLNSLIVTSTITAGQVITAALAGYVFARIAFPGREAIFYLYLSTLFIPTQVTMLPLFLIMNRLGWMDTYQGLTFPFLANAFSIFFLRQFFATVPRELEDAAIMDGCNRLRLLVQIMVPLSRPALATIALFIFLSHWDDYLWPLIITNSEAMRTLPVGLRFFVVEAGTQYHYMIAGAVIAVVPVVLFFLVAQKQFVQGIALTGLRG